MGSEISLLALYIEGEGFTPDAIWDIRAIGLAQVHEGAPHTGRLLVAIANRLEVERQPATGGESITAAVEGDESGHVE